MATANFIQKPSSLSLLGNLPDIKIVAGGDVAVILSADGEDILSQSYTPGQDGIISIDLKDVLAPRLSFLLKDVSSPYRQPSIAKTFRVAAGSDVCEFTVVRAGIDHFADSAQNFLRQNFLTWQPNIKPVTYSTPEFLTYYAVDSAVIKCKAYIDNGDSVTEQLLTLAEIPAGEVWTIPVQYAVIAGKTNALPSYYDVWAETTGGVRQTYIQRYYASDMKSEEEQWILFENSLGGIDTFRAYGNTSSTATHTHNVVEIDEVSEEYRVDTSREFQKNSGHLNSKERRWLLDFFPSLGKYIYIDKYIRRIVVTESDVNYSAKELPSQFTFTFRYSDATPYLNLPRTDTPLGMLSIKIPDLGSFTLAPRLVEFDRLSLSAGALFPVQSPYSETWSVVTFEAVLDFITTHLLQGGMGGGVGHSHPNLSLLNKLDIVGRYLLVGAEKIFAAYADEAYTISKDSPVFQMFLRKDMPDRTPHKLTMGEAEVGSDATVGGKLKANVITPSTGNTVEIGEGSVEAKVNGSLKVTEGAEFQGMTQHRKGLQVGVYTGNGILGTGAQIDEGGNAVVESLTARGFFMAPEYRFNRITVTDGETWSTNGLGTIESVTPITRTTGYISLHLDEGEYGSVMVGDICRGIYNEMAAGVVEGGVLLNEDGTFDDCGFKKRYGFFTSYFWVKEIVEYEEGRCTFLYELRNASTPHPCKFMKFAQYGNFIDETRQSFSYENTHPAWYRVVYVGVSSWVVQPENISQLQGCIKGFTIKLRDGNYFTFPDRGMYIDKNIFFGEAITEIDPATIEKLKDELELYNIELDIAADTITVDPTGNVIGGLWTEEKSGGQTYRKYRLHTAITAKKGEDFLLLGDEAKDTGSGEYKIHVASGDCDYFVENGTVYITRIKNIKDQTAGSDDDVNFDYDAMREMKEVKVTIIVDCEGRGSVNRTFCVTVNHVDTAFISATLDNQVANVSWNTKSSKYIGLPYTFNIKAWHNTEDLQIKSIAIDGLDKSNYTKVEDGKGGFSGAITIQSLSEELAEVTNVNVTFTVEYAGVNYERTLIHTINKTQDTNVYELVPSPSSINAWKEGDEMKFSSGVLVCQVRCTSNEDEPYMLTPSQITERGLSVIVQRKNSGTFEEEKKYNSEDILMVKDGDEQFVFFLLSGEKCIDEQEVLVIFDGEDAAVYELRPSANTIVRRQDETISPKELYFFAYRRQGEFQGAFIGFIVIQDNIGNTIFAGYGASASVPESRLNIAAYPITAKMWVSEADSIGNPVAEASVSLVSDGNAAIAYSIETGIDTIKIAPNDKDATISSYAYFYEKKGTNGKKPFKCYSWIYVRQGTSYLPVQTPTTTGESRLVALDKSYVNINYDAVVIFINDNPQTFNVTSGYLAKKEIQIRKDGDSGTGIADTETEYGLGDSCETPPLSISFGKSFPTMTSGKYVWMRQRFVYTDATFSAWIYICTTGKAGDKGLTGQSVRVRGVWSKNTDYENNADYIDVVLHSSDGKLYSWYKCEKTHKSGNSFPLAVDGEDIWSLFSKFENLATSVLLANQGYIDVLGAGRLWIGMNAYGNGVVGWLITEGMMRHTGTGLTLTADGHIYDPDGLHFKVGTTTKKGANLIPDAYLDYAEEIGLRSGLVIGTTSSPTRSIEIDVPAAVAFGLYCFKLTASCVSNTMSDRDIYTTDVLANGHYGHRIRLQPHTTYTFSMYINIEKGSYIQQSSSYVFLYNDDVANATQYVSAYCVPFDLGKGDGIQRVELTFSTEEAVWFDYRLGFWVRSATAKSSVSFDAVKLEIGNEASVMSNDFDYSGYFKKGLKKTGIDIDEGKITIISNNFVVENNYGDETFYVDGHGDVAVAGYISEKITYISNLDDWLGRFFPISNVYEFSDNLTLKAGSTTVYGNNETLTRTGYPMLENNEFVGNGGFMLDSRIGKHWGMSSANYGMLDLCKCNGIINISFQPRGAGGSAVETVVYLPWLQFNTGNACKEVVLPSQNAMAVRLAPYSSVDRYKGSQLFTNGDSEVVMFPPYTAAFRHGAPTTGVAKAQNLLPKGYALYFNIKVNNSTNYGTQYSVSDLVFVNNTNSEITLTSARICYYYITKTGNKTSNVACGASEARISMSETNVRLYAYISINETYQTNAVLIAEYNGYGMQFLRTVTTFGNQQKHLTTYEEMLGMLGKRFVIHNNTETDMYIIYDTQNVNRGFCYGYINLPPNSSMGFTMIQEENNGGTITQTFYTGDVTKTLMLPKLYFKPDNLDGYVIDFARTAFNSANFGKQVYFEDN